MALLLDPVEAKSWRPGSAPVAVILISLNEAHNMSAVLESISGWAQEVFLVDSYSKDETVDIALQEGVRVVQRKFLGFGDQWNFALSKLPITAPWTMKLDPDERLTEALKQEIVDVLCNAKSVAYSIPIRLFFMKRALPVRLNLCRLWKTGSATMSNVTVNEHLQVAGSTGQLSCEIEHHDSPDLDHWLEKQNRYTTAEATIFYTQSGFAETPRLFGTTLQRRMWLKANFRYLPFRFLLLFLFYLFVQGTWRAGWVGFTWAHLRCDVMRLIEYKRKEMEITGRMPTKRVYGAGSPDLRVPQYD